MKTCTKCGKTEEEVEFYSSRARICENCKDVNKEDAMTRAEAINKLVDYNIPFDPKEEETADLIAKAEEIEPEPYYLCEIDDAAKSKLYPWAKINGKMKVFERGKKVYIRKRYFDKLTEKHTIIEENDTKSGRPIVKHVRNETIMVLKIVPEDEVPKDKR